MGKKRVNINIDEDVWKLLKIALPCSRSEFFEKQAREYIFGKSELEELENQYKENQLTGKSIKSKIDNIKKLQEANNNNEKIIQKAMETIRKIFIGHGYIGKNQISNIAKIHKISYEVLLQEVEKENIKIQNFGAEY